MTRAPLAAALALAFAGALAAQKELEAKVEQLAAADAAARSQAYTALLRERNPEVVPLLGKRIDALPPDGQQYALYLLQQFPLDATRALYTRLLAAERPLLRAWSAAMLVRGGDRARLAGLVKAVGEAPAAERLQVLNAVWGVDDAALVDAVRGYLTADASGALVASALAHLRQQEKGRSAATNGAARGLATATAPDARAAALAWLVGGADGDAFAAELVRLLQGEPNRFWLVERLFERDHKYPPALTALFAQALETPRFPYDVAAAAALLRAQAPDQVAPSLHKLLAHANADVRTAAMQALAAMPGGLESKELQQLLRTGTLEQQVAAAAVLRRTDDLSGLPVVLDAVKQPGKHLAEAVRVLATFRSRAAVEPLLAALDDGNAAVRQNAWFGLQPLLRDLFPYRRFDFDRCGYNPNANERTKGLEPLRAWWAAVK
ncbi:MAG: hypothetical protein QM775_25000 [Pirellulales bacterium]